MDYTAACVTWWLRARVTPARIGQSIASGLLGPQFVPGRVWNGAPGIRNPFPHRVYRRDRLLSGESEVEVYDRALPRCWCSLRSGGLHLYVLGGDATVSSASWAVFMELTILAIVTHIFCVGLPIAIAVRKYGAAPLQV